MSSLSSGNVKLAWTRTPGELIPVIRDSAEYEHLLTNHVLKPNHRETHPTGT